MKNPLGKFHFHWPNAALLLLLLANLMKVAASAQAPVREETGRGVPSSNSVPDLSAIDTDVSPCQDFYQYACGNWMKNHSIPSDQPWWGKYSDFFSSNDAFLRDILQQAREAKSHRTKAEQIVGDYYAACMDESAAEKKGVAPLQSELKAIASLQSKNDVARELARLHSIGAPALFRLRSRRDLNNSSRMVAELDAGGISLPGRDYYLKDGAEIAKVRDEYLAHVAKMFQLSGEEPSQAEANAHVVIGIESRLAKSSLDSAARREPGKLNHKVRIDDLAGLVPSFSWTIYFHEVGLPEDTKNLNVTEPDFFKAINELLVPDALGDLKTYLRWRLIDSFAPLLSHAFATEDFRFYGGTLNGKTENAPRWKQCVDLVNERLGEAVGQVYVAHTLQRGGKTRALKLVQEEKAVLLEAIKSSSWMTEETKRNAIAKLDAIILKIGYPDYWKDYSSLRITSGDLVSDSININQFETRRRLSKIGQAASNAEWTITPQTIDASYDPQENTMSLPAGILRPPFYMDNGDPAANFGVIGAVIGHELTHGFDDEGRKFDLNGNLHDWWTKEDSSQFDQRAQCFVQEYSDFEVLPGLKANGKLTAGENIADNGGVRIAYAALMNTLREESPDPASTRVATGFNPAQRFFLSYAQLWCQNMRDSYVRQRTLSNEHSLGPLRVNGVVQNMPEFGTAFSCRATDKMVRQPVCRLW